MSFINTTLEPELDKLPDELRVSVAVSIKQWHEQLAGVSMYVAALEPRPSV